MLDMNQLLFNLSGSKDGTDLVDLIEAQGGDWHEPITGLGEAIPHEMTAAARILNMIDLSSLRLHYLVSPMLVYIRTGIKTSVDPETGDLTDTVTGESYGKLASMPNPITKYPLKVQDVDCVIDGGTLDLVLPNGLRFSSESLYPYYDELYAAKAVPDPYSDDSPSRRKIMAEMVGYQGELLSVSKEDLASVLMGLSTGLTLHVASGFGIAGREGHLPLFTPATMDDLDAGTGEPVTKDDWDKVLAR